MIVSYFRTIVLYLLLILVIRIMGKREIGQMEPTEFVVTMLISNLASIPMEDTQLPIWAGVVPILTVLGLELILATLSMKSIKLRQILCGKPVILIENGRIVQENLRKTQVTMDELTGQLRLKDVLELESVQYAILETNGNLSVFPFPQTRPASAQDAGVQTKEQSLPVTIISDGRLLEKNLARAGKDLNWLEKVLRKHKTDLSSTWYLTVDNSNHVFFCAREGKK